MLLQRALAVARRVFIVVVAFYLVMEVLSLAGALHNGLVVGLDGRLIALLIFLVAYGIFAWFAEPLYLARERRKNRR
jgi:hypothetical protein